MTEYLLRQQEAPDLERARLELLAEVHDPLTRAQLDAIGVGEGWRCLDVGAGGGAVTRMLAERVGNTGSVLAIDLDTSLLEALADDRIEVRRHDLMRAPLPADRFDLVHARLLLIHLPSRLDALRRLARAARPGGWVAAMDPDFTTVALSPANLAWERTWSAFLDAVIVAGWDPRYGARLCGEMWAIGLADVHGEYVGSREPGGSVPARLLSLTLERVRDRLIAFGAESEDRRGQARAGGSVQPVQLADQMHRAGAATGRLIVADLLSAVGWRSRCGRRS
ncbi:MAG TPA: methyltransferase domain-containing protein [Solirubrobacteraceae bacterium]|nr:methyltransferase domain-containing protein [Solirubrobacteraceae bacterium]